MDYSSSNKMASLLQVNIAGVAVELGRYCWFLCSVINALYFGTSAALQPVQLPHLNPNTAIEKAVPVVCNKFSSSSCCSHCDTC